jgi:hypothetical protein
VRVRGRSAAELRARFQPLMTPDEV